MSVGDQLISELVGLVGTFFSAVIGAFFTAVVTPFMQLVASWMPSRAQVRWKYRAASRELPPGGTTRAARAASPIRAPRIDMGQRWP